jgi:hypothetical protein
MRRRSVPLGLSLVALVLGGCGGESPGGHGGGGHGGAAYDGLIASAKDTYEPGTSPKETLPLDPARWASVSAIGTDGTTYPGTLKDGEVRIPSVPQGPYVLAITYPDHDDGVPGGHRYIRTSARQLDLGSEHSCRSGLVAMTQPSMITLDATLGLPWHTTTDPQGNPTGSQEDVLQLYSRGTGTLGAAVVDYSAPTMSPLDGDTKLSGWQIDLQSALQAAQETGVALFDAAQGDTLDLLHNVATHVVDPARTDGWADYTYDATAEALRSAPFTLADGGEVSLQGSFTPAPQKTFSLDYRGSEFEALLSDAPGKLLDGWLDVGLWMEPGTPRPHVGGFATLFEVSYLQAKKTNVDPACTGPSCDYTLAFPGDYAHDFSYGNPFDTGQELAFAQVYFRVDVAPLLPNDTQGPKQRLSGYFNLTAPAGELAGGPIRPTVSLPRNVKVNGAAAPTDAITTVGPTPTITFDAPSLGEPTSYQINVVAVDDLVDASGAVVASSYGVGLFDIEDRSLRLPEGLLESGKHYYFQVRALLHPDGDPAAPFHYALHAAEAQTFSGLVTP